MWSILMKVDRPAIQVDVCIKKEKGEGIENESKRFCRKEKNGLAQLSRILKVIEEILE